MKTFFYINYRLLTINNFMCLFFLTFLSVRSFGQQENKNYLLLNAVVLTSDSLSPINNAHIISKFNHWGTISDENGNFKMYVSPFDSLLITSIGFRPLILYVSEAMLSNIVTYPILMKRDTVQINEIVIHAFWDYRTFKQLVINMEPLSLDKVYNYIGGINKELEYNPAYAGIKGPIQALYDQFNKSARLERQLIKNRADYNLLMIQMGKIQDTIPAIPEHMQGSQH